MRLSQAWLVARHDIGLLRKKRAVMYGLVGFSLAVSVGFPLLVRVLITRNNNIPAALLPTLMDAFSFWFVIGATMLPVGVATYSLVGEKLERSLEPLLSTPTTDGEILMGKTLAALLPTLIALWGGSALFMVLMDRVTEPKLGYAYFPNPEMGIVLLVLAPLTALVSIQLSVLISSRVTDVRSAQQLASLLIFPFALIYVLGETGVFDLSTTNLGAISGGLAVAAVALFLLSRTVFRRDEILTRWK